MNNRIWECLLCLRDVLFYVCAPALAREHVLLMADVIEEFRDCQTQASLYSSLSTSVHGVWSPGSFAKFSV